MIPRRLLLIALVLLSAAQIPGCALYSPDFGKELVSVPVDQLPVSDLNSGPLNDAVLVAAGRKP